MQGIGVVIGHEITHGFDDKGYTKLYKNIFTFVVLKENWLICNFRSILAKLGRQFDKEGNMKQWWNNATINAFRDRAQCMIDQYSRYKVNELGLYMNGKLTQSENIADNGGLKQAFRVKSLKIQIYILQMIQRFSVCLLFC